MASDRKPESDRGDELFETFTRKPRESDSRAKSRTPDDMTPSGAGGAPKPGIWCSECRTVLRSHYFVLNERPLCARCQQPYSIALAHGSGVKAAGRAILYGLGAAVAGIVLMAAVLLTVGFARYFCAIAIGYLVGKAVNAATKGVGGWGYQLLAVVLTYFAIGIGLATPAVAELVNASRAARHAGSAAPIAHAPGVRRAAPLGDPAAVVEDSSAASIADSSVAAAGASDAARPRGIRQGRASGVRGLIAVLGGALLTLLVLPLVAAFAGGLFSVFVALLSLFALVLGMYKAWQLAEGGPEIRLTGPFRVGMGPIAPTH
ncbi:MAG: hypothetical protein M3081_15010 [Gemmatimonadota bacterium]|nr:hypothetical protein [Gemmatimonadota bacterium]